MTTNTTTVKLTQQQTNLLRQVLNTTGWSDSILDLYLGGKMLSDNGGLPVLDDVSWMKPQEEIAKMTKEELAAYLVLDKAWGDKEYEVVLTQKEKDCIEKAFKATVKKGLLAPNTHWVRIIDALGFKLD